MYGGGARDAFFEFPHICVCLLFPSRGYVRPRWKFSVEMRETTRSVILNDIAF